MARNIHNIHVFYTRTIKNLEFIEKYANKSDETKDEKVYEVTQLINSQDFRLPHPPAPSPILGEGEKNAS